jgi:hypothetical protein
MKNPDLTHASSEGPGRFAGLLVGLCALLAAVGLGYFYLKVFSPQPYFRNENSTPTYDTQAMFRAVDPAEVAKRQADLLKFGSRFLGEPGTQQAGEYMEAAFKNAGLDVIEHQVTTASPLTEYREIYRQTPDDHGSYQLDQKLGDVEVYPFFPNFLQPVATGKNGVAGQLVLATRELLATGKRFDNQIALIDAKTGAYDSDFGFNWTRYARIGFKAVIVSDSAGLADIPWAKIAGRDPGKTTLVSSSPVNFVRLAATPAIFQHVGENIRLRVKVRFVAAPNTTYYAVFHAPHPARQAIALLIPYDVPSVLPDMAPGGVATVSPAFALQFLQGLQSYGDSIQRDVIFIAYGSSTMGEDGVNHLARILQANTKQAQDNPLLKALGIRTKPAENKRVQHLQENEAANLKLLEPVQRVGALFEDAAFLADAPATDRAVNGLPDAAKKVLSDQFAYVMDSLVVELSEPMLQRKIDFLHSPGQNVHGPEFQAYIEAKRQLDSISNYAGYSPQSLLRENPDLIRQYGLRDRLRGRMAELLAYHQHVAKQLEEEQAIARLFNSYEDVSFFGCRLVPAMDAANSTDGVMVAVGSNLNTTPRALGVFNVFLNASHRLPDKSPQVQVSTPDQQSYATPPDDLVSESVTDLLDRWGYSTYTIYDLNRDPTYGDFSSPVIKPYMLNLGSLRGAFNVYAGALLAFAHGQGPVAPSVVAEWIYFSFGGQVLVSGIGQSVVPHYPLDGAAIANRPMENQEVFSRAGRYENPIILTDPYGKFRLEYNTNDFAAMWRVFASGGYSPIAVGYDDDGMIKFIKDEGEDGQRLFKSVNLSIATPARENTTIVTFRAAPLTLLDLTNPQTMKDYTNVEFISKEGLSDFGKVFSMAGPGLSTTYLEPDRRTYVLLQAGAPGNDLVQETRAFMLGIEDPWTFKMTRDIDGPGYLAADNRLLGDIPVQAAQSMAAVNGNRLALQRHYHMDDEQTDAYQQKTLSNLKASENADQSLHESTHFARDAVTYATLNHPVIREKIIEAVISIIWYLALLVPFVFFFEKLAFGFADVRLQICAQVGIFLVVFFLLWLLHPAFAMVRSSLMILLGFVIILISGGITLLFSSKFKENLEDLRKRQGRVSGADVNTMGVVGTAFLLGLNNMHRRKVRTGLTCATLTLLTFVMISFTSVQNSVIEEDIAIGKASYQGLLIKKESFAPITDAEVFAFRSKYGEKYDVCPRRFLIGGRDWATGKRGNPKLDLSFKDAAGNARSFEFHSVLQFAAEEPLRNQIKMVGKPAWFTPEQGQEGSGPIPILISDKAASSVGISPEQIDSPAGVSVQINGTEYKVIGIFSADSLDQLRDLDGLDLRPFNIEAVQDLVADVRNGTLLVKNDAPRIPAAELFISPLRDIGSQTGHVGSNTVTFALENSSLAISMPHAGYKEASEQIVSFMEQIAQPVFYGLDGEAYKGKRTREVTLAGLVDLIIPLIIAGLTVLNTMSGSVYERRDEIFVYNAVGIAPRYVFFMFMAEALVYAVVGSVLGYLISQGVGRILTELGWTGGLNMTYTSLSTIYASLTIMVAVFVSTYFPARSAMEIAKPADEAGWKLPESEGDTLAFDLPFNFLSRGRMAVLSFFDRYLLDHAEGGMGTFSAATPRLAVESLDSGEAIPCLETTVWLKPFDLAVSQKVTISMPRDEETGQFKARITITRLSGTRESWLRLNKSFVLLVRRHFLYWRAVGPAEQEEMFLEAKAKFEREMLGTPSLAPA